MPPESPVSPVLPEIPLSRSAPGTADHRQVCHGYVRSYD